MQKCNSRSGVKKIKNKEIEIDLIIQSNRKEKKNRK